MFQKITPATFCLLAISLCLLCSFSGLNAQTTNLEPVSEVIAIEALTSDETEWKISSDYNAVIISERAATAESLNTPNLTSAEIALYTGYDRMLAYMQTDMAVKDPIETVAEKNFKKVLADASTDPALANLPDSAFTLLYANLLTKLIIK
jgi:hypothetical protein